MPVYTYHCENCTHEFDQHQSFSEDALIICPVCRKHQLRKVYKPARIVFKGSGFYVNDKKAAPSKSKTGTPKSTSNGKSTTKESKPKSKDKSATSKSSKSKVS